jgi:hypothetical protein
MKTLILFVSLLACASSVQAQQTALLGHPDGRKSTPLSGEWQTIVDPYESGFYD